MDKEDIYYRFYVIWYDNDLEEHIEKGFICATNIEEAIKKILESYEQIVDLRVFEPNADTMYVLEDKAIKQIWEQENE